MPTVGATVIDAMSAIGATERQEKQTGPPGMISERTCVAI
jgi:hypothetical protein